MNFSHAYGVPVSAEEGERVPLAALDTGMRLFDTAALCGFGANEELVGRVLKPHRRRITLCSKGGMAGVKGEDGVTRRVIDGRPPRCAARTPCTPSPPCRPSTRCGRATRRSRCSTRAASWARPSWPSAPWRGFLCGELVDVGALHEKNIRRAMPRVAPGAYAANLNAGSLGR